MADEAPEPLSLDEVKLNLKVEDDEEDDLITALIVAAREHVEDYTGLVLTRRTVVEYAASLARWIDLAAFPIADITSISYLDPSGATQQLAPSGWTATLGSRPVRMMPRLAKWGAASAPAIWSALPVTITMTAGYATPEEVPATVKQAMHLLIGNWYANREADVVLKSVTPVELPTGVKALLRRHRARAI